MRNTQFFTLLLALSLCITSSFAQTQTIGTNVGSSVNFSSNGTLTIPAGYDLTIQVEAYGAGGGSQEAMNHRSGGGGGGYFSGTYTVSGCNSFNITVGQGAMGQAGGSTSFNIGGSVVVGGGGVGGLSGGAGGTVTGSGTKITGGKGGGRETNPSGEGGGGGGGGAGPGNGDGDSGANDVGGAGGACLLYTSPSPRDRG